MDFLRKYLAQIKAQLAGLTLSQRLLIALLVVVMIATIFFTVSMSAKPDLVVLIPQPMTSEEINRAEMALKGKYQYQIQGDRIMVPAEKAYQIRGELFALQALPKDTTQAFAKLMEDNDFLRPERSNDRRWNYALQETLAKILRGFPYIEDAQVIISKGDRVGIGRPEVPSSAMVTVKVRGGDVLSSGNVLAIADMIRGATAGMRREDVKITDGVRSYSAPSEGQQLPTTALELKKSIEDDLTGKLRNIFGDYGNVKIAVNAVPDMSSGTEQSTIYGKEPVKAEEKNSHSETSTIDGVNGGQPGVSSNAAAVAAPSAGRSSEAKTSTDTVSNVVKIDEHKKSVVIVGGTKLADLTASIVLPRSYFVATYRRNQKDPKADPDDAQLAPTITAKLKDERDKAKVAIGISLDEKIRVDWFDDTIIARADADGNGKGSTVASSFASITQYAKQGILGIVAVGALFMMLMMVRKAVPAAAGAGADADPSVFFGGAGSGGKRRGGGKGEPDQLDASEDIFGEAGEGEAVLTGIELDDETLASRKMVDEVSTMVKENPENAAALIKRWIAKGK